jgi:hypothetical protein
MTGSAPSLGPVTASPSSCMLAAAAMPAPRPRAPDPPPTARTPAATVGSGKRSNLIAFPGAGCASGGTLLRTTVNYQYCTFPII